MMSIDIKSVFILNIHGVHFHCIIVWITKTEATYLSTNADFSVKSDHYEICIFFIMHKRWKNK